MTEETNNPGGSDPTPEDDALKGDPELPPGSATPTDPDPTDDDAALRSGDPELPPG
jgi:hypothetical protein